MKIGEVAAALDIPTSTIRYYERVGLLPQIERVAGQRSFGTQELNRLKFIKLAQVAGFTLAEIKQLNSRYSADPRPNRLWSQMAQAKKTSVTAQIAELEAVHTVLDKLMACECQSLQQCIDTAETMG